MTHQSAPLSPILADAGRQIAQLRQVRHLVGQIAGRSAVAGDSALDENARVAVAYDDAMPIVRRRFDALAAETAAWAAAGVAALIAAGRDGEPPKAAAAMLADELDRALARLAVLLRV
ncbi:hypothetical protein [Allosphingosinicella sp.]|uniref:hypothetical protein n=1 Tax=Allosphingosinicella sp. TaxID=2823234 RepID=UPI002FC22288